MEQFNLEEYLKNTKRKVVTRYGHDVKILRVDDSQVVNFPVVALCNITRFAEERNKSLSPDEAAFLEKAIKWLEGQCIRRNGKIALISIDEFKKAMEK